MYDRDRFFISSSGRGRPGFKEEGLATENTEGTERIG